MNEFYIAISGDFYGYFGSGATVADAKKNLRRVGGSLKKCRVAKFTSELPFVGAGNKREATEGEADAVGQDGSLNWIRCEREWLEGRVRQ